LDTDIPDELPPNDFTRYFKPITKLHIKPDRTINCNTPEYINQCVEHVYETLRNIQPVPSVPYLDIPALFMTPPSTPETSEEVYEISDDDNNSVQTISTDNSIITVSENDFYDDYS